jgi:hypothetical protein
MTRGQAPRSDSIVGWFLPSMPVLVFVLIFWISLFFMPKIMNAGDGDLGRHITSGSVILATGQIPTQDLFSHTMSGALLYPKEWLSQVLFAVAFRIAGLNGIAWLTALILAATYGFLAIGLRRLGVNLAVTLAGGLIASAVGSLHALTRPHILSWLLFTLFLLVLEDYRRTSRRRTLWLLLPLMVAWANLHGAFIYGLVLIALYFIGAVLEGERRRAIELFVFTILVILASFVNPVGPAMLTHNLDFLQNRFLTDLSTEYASPNFHIISTWPFAALLAASIVIIGRTGQRLNWTLVILLSCWTAFALYSVRNVPLYAQVAVFILAPYADRLMNDWLPRATPFLSHLDGFDRLANGWVWAIVAVVFLVGLESSGTNLDPWGMGNTFDPHVFPVAAVDGVKASPPAGEMFNEFNWGGYLLYRLWPDKKVFIDGWIDFYGEGLTREYLQALNAEPGWETILDRHQVQWVIIAPTRPLAVRLDESPAWGLRYKDQVAGVWVRR